MGIWEKIKELFQKPTLIEEFKMIEAAAEKVIEAEAEAEKAVKKIKAEVEETVAKVRKPRKKK